MIGRLPNSARFVSSISNPCTNKVIEIDYPKHLKPMPTIFDLKIEDEGATTSHEIIGVNLGDSKNEYFKKMNRNLRRPCADLSAVDKIGSPLLPDSPLEQHSKSGQTGK